MFAAEEGWGRSPMAGRSTGDGDRVLAAASESHRGGEDGNAGIVGAHVACPHDVCARRVAALSRSGGCSAAAVAIAPDRPVIIRIRMGGGGSKL